MFENLLKQLKQLERTTVSVPVSVDDKGYLDKECPNENCMFQFKVKADDWHDLFSDDSVFCPKCRHEANADSWWTTEQLATAKQQAIKQIRGAIGEAIRKDAKGFNNSQPKGGFISLSLNVSGISRKHIVVPIRAQKEMQLEIECEKCNANYAVIGSAFFCPCCGHNSVEKTFDDSIKKVEVKIKNIPLIKTALEEAGQVDEAEITCLSLIETSLSDCVVAFQRFSEETYRRYTKNSEIPHNAFQRLDQGSKLWNSVFSEGYDDWLSTKELNELLILFQKRHLLAHSEGIVDDKYVSKSKDNSYQVGQRIVVREKDILQLIKLIQKLVLNIRQKTK
ncbi:hypothetical protein [Spirosoma lituiforme]